MRHYKKKVTLDRPRAGRQALLRNLVENIVLFETITTTKAKAKAAQPIVERLITVAKANTLFARRRLAARLYTAPAVKKLMEVLGPRYQDRQGGYTRITLLKNRIGDGAEEAVIALI